MFFQTPDILKFSAFKLDNPVHLTNTSGKKIISIIYFAFSVQWQSQKEVITLTPEIIISVKKDLLMIDDHCLISHAHYCTHYPVIEKLCWKFYLDGCTDPNHSELHNLPEVFGINTSNFCGQHFSNNCNNMRCTKIHQTMKNLEDSMMAILQKKRDECTQCERIPCKMLFPKRRKPCHHFMIHGKFKDFM